MTRKSNWANAGQRLTRALVRNPADAEWPRWGLIAALVTLIGFIDYWSGIEVSVAILYLGPVLLATGWFGFAPGIVVSLLTTSVRVSTDLLISYPHALPLHSFWNAFAALGISLFIVSILSALLTLQRHLEGEVQERTTQLRDSIAARQRLEREILDVSERERGAFGRELHDELGQHLVATALAAQVLTQTLEPGARAAQARAIVRWIEEGIAKTRKLARGLLLARIEPDRLPQELEELAVNASKAGVPSRVLVKGRPIAASAGDCAQLFRIAQEAVGNALRHANARAIDLMLVSDESALCLIVEDNGCGLPVVPPAGAGVGLKIMEHRAKFIGASFSIISAPGEGTKIICCLPNQMTAADPG
ncbi:MAG: ATP-binding protein [Opitutaceae bacterium]